MVMFLSKRAIDLLLRAMEARSASVQGATLHQVSPQATEILLEAKLLVAGGRVPDIHVNLFTQFGIQPRNDIGKSTK